jgi:hypothetical protein
MTTVADLYALSGARLPSPELYGLDPHAFCLEFDDTPLLSVFCRNPLHPGPCKGWKKKLGMVDPKTLDDFETRRKTNVATKRAKRQQGKSDFEKIIAKNPKLAEHPLSAKKQAAHHAEIYAGATAAQAQRKFDNTKLNAAERKRFAKFKGAQIGSFAEANGLTSDGKKYAAYAQKEIEKALLLDNQSGGEEHYRVALRSISDGLSFSFANNKLPECNNPKEGDADCDGIAYEALRTVAQASYVEAFSAGDMVTAPSIKNLDVIAGMDPQVIKNMAKELGADLDGLQQSLDAFDDDEIHPDAAAAVQTFLDFKSGLLSEEFGPLSAFELWVGKDDFDKLPQNVQDDYKAFLVQTYAGSPEGSQPWLLSDELHTTYFGHPAQSALDDEIENDDEDDGSMDHLPTQEEIDADTSGPALGGWQKMVVESFKPGGSDSDEHKYSLAAGLVSEEYKALPDETKTQIVDFWVANFEADKAGNAPSWWKHEEATKIGKRLGFIPDYWNGPGDNPSGTDPHTTGSAAQNNVAAIIMQPNVLKKQKLDAIGALTKEEYDDLPPHIQKQVKDWLNWFTGYDGGAGGLKPQATGVMAKLGEGQVEYYSFDPFADEPTVQKLTNVLKAVKSHPTVPNGYGEHVAKLMPIETLTEDDWKSLDTVDQGYLNQVMLAALADPKASKSMPLVNKIQAMQAKFGKPVGIGGKPLPGSEAEMAVQVDVQTSTGTGKMAVSPELEEMFQLATGAKKGTLTQKLAAYAKVTPEEFGNQLNNAAKAKVVDDLIAMKGKFLDQKKLTQAAELQDAFNNAPVSTPMYGGSPAIIISQDGLSEFVPSAEVHQPKAGTTKQPGQGKPASIDIGTVSSAIDTSGLTAGQKTAILGAFKMQPTGYMLSHDTEDVWDNVVAITAAFSGKKGYPKLTPGKVLAAIDEEHSKNLGVSNGHMQAEKVANWLATSNGKAYAQSHLTPDPDKVQSISGDFELPKGIKLKPGEKVQKLKGPGKYDPNKPTTDFKVYDHYESVAERNAYFAKTGTKWNAQQKNALIAYTSASGPMNDYLRGETLNPGKSVQESVLHAQAGMYPLQKDHRLFRGTDMENFPKDWRSLDVLKTKIGKVFTDDGFTSSSVGGSAAFGSQPVVLEIEAPAGTPAAYLNDISNYGVNSLNEREMLLAAGTRFRVLAVEQAGGQIRVKVRVVS